jgi:hypothetical protein
MKAPVDPRFETDSTYEARNTKFELLLGARFHLAGGAVTMGGLADLCVNRAGFRLYVECKRPQGEQKIRKRTAEACAQLLNRFNAETHPNPVGMVAISVSRALTGGEKMLYVDREADIESTLTQEAERIRRSYCGAISEADPRVIGLICHSFTPTLIRPERRLVAASQFDIFPRNVDDVLPLSRDDLRILLRCL